MRVDVYWHTSKRLYSVRHKGKVIAHMRTIELTDVDWIVQPGGRARAQREGRKNAHAFARGQWDGAKPTICDNALEWADAVMYSYDGDPTFVRCYGHEPVSKSKRAVLTWRASWKGRSPQSYAMGGVE